MGVLLDQQHGGATGANVGHDTKHLLHNERRQTERGFVQQQQARLGHQPARHRNHLQLPARQRPAQHVFEALEIGEIDEHIIHLARQRRPADAFAVGGAQRDVLAHGQAREHPPPLRHMTDAKANDGFRLQPQQRLALIPDRAGEIGHEAGDGAQGGAFAGAVRAEQGHDLPLLHIQRQPLEHIASPVAGHECVDFKQLHSGAPRDRRRSHRGW